MKNSKSKKYGKIALDSVSHKFPIFPVEELKAILDRVQKDAKEHPCITTKTTELMVLIMSRGLRENELLRLNIEDLPCDDRSTIIVKKHRDRDSEYREVYLLDDSDDSLGNKINKYVKKHRKGAKPKDPLFVSGKNRTRTKSGVVGCKLWGQKPHPSRKYNAIGLSQKLGIKPLNASMFRRTAVYQLRGRQNADTTAEIKRLKSNKRAITIPQFIKKYVEPDISENRLKSLCNILRKAEKQGVKLPNPIKTWTSGQRKEYDEMALLMNWNGVADKLDGRLPHLITTHIKISE